MLYGGLRISEALNVKLCDFEEVDDEILKISIIGKGGKEQFAFIIKKKKLKTSLSISRKIFKIMIT